MFFLPLLREHIYFWGGQSARVVFHSAPQRVGGRMKSLPLGICLSGRPHVLEIDGFIGHVGVVWFLGDTSANIRGPRRYMVAEPGPQVLALCKARLLTDCNHG